MSDGKLGIELPDGARQYEFADGHICAWSFSSARANPMRFETPQAARLSWELTKGERWVSQIPLAAVQDGIALVPTGYTFCADRCVYVEAP